MIVSTSTAGRLGNRLQVSAFALAFAIDNERTAAVLAMGKYARHFVGPSSSWFHLHPPVATVAAPSTTHPRVRQSIHRVLCQLDRVGLVHRIEGREPPFLKLECRSLPRRRPIHLDGHYFYATRLLKKHSSTVRRFFQPLPSYSTEIDEAFEDYRKKFDRIVGVHIRHGDYRKWQSGRHFFHVEEYAHATKEAIDSPCNNTLFVVVSDEDIQKGQLTGLPHTINSSSPIKDLYTLSKCDIIVGPFSTFNIWASFFGKVPRFEIRRVGSTPKATSAGTSTNLEEIIDYKQQDE